MASSSPLVDFIVKQLDAGKGDSVAVLNVSKKASFTDHMVIASGTSSRHVMALIHHLAEALKKKGVRCCIEGKGGPGNWVVLDAGSVIVHVFHPDARAYYALDEVWK